MLGREIEVRLRMKFLHRECEASVARPRPYLFLVVREVQTTIVTAARLGNTGRVLYLALRRARAHLRVMATVCTQDAIPLAGRMIRAGAARGLRRARQTSQTGLIQTRR